MQQRRTSKHIHTQLQRRYSGRIITVHEHWVAVTIASANARPSWKGCNADRFWDAPLLRQQGEQWRAFNGGVRLSRSCCDCSKL